MATDVLASQEHRNASIVAHLFSRHPQRNASVGMQRAEWVQFGHAEQFLLDEARERYEFEQKSSATLHSKSTLYLTASGMFAAVITTAVIHFWTHAPVTKVDTTTLFLLLLSLLLLAAAVVVLVHTALSHSYQVIASPSHWLRHLAVLRNQLAHDQGSEDRVLARLQTDVLDAWIEAVDACHCTNKGKAVALKAVSTLVCAAVVTALAGVLLTALQSL